MIKITFLAIAACLLIAAAIHAPVEAPIKGSWKLVRAQYGSGEMKDLTPDEQVYKMFTGTRWSGAFYSTKKKKFDGAGGGTYVLKGDQYLETLEYYSWDPEAVGKKFTFTMKMENGLLHQKGTIEYKGNPKYVIDEWFERVD